MLYRVHLAWVGFELTTLVVIIFFVCLKKRRKKKTNVIVIFTDTFRSLEKEKKINPRARKLERILADKLSQFLSSDVLYSVRRVMMAEMKYIYKGPGKGIISSYL